MQRSLRSDVPLPKRSRSARSERQSCTQRRRRSGGTAGRITSSSMNPPYASDDSKSSEGAMGAESGSPSTSCDLDAVCKCPRFWPASHASEGREHLRTRGPRPSRKMVSVRQVVQQMRDPLRLTLRVTPTVQNHGVKPHPTRRGPAVADEIRRGGAAYAAVRRGR